MGFEAKTEDIMLFTPKALVRKRKSWFTTTTTCTQSTRSKSGCTHLFPQRFFKERSLRAVRQTTRALWSQGFWFKKALKHIGLSVKLVFEGEEEVPTCGAIFLKTSADSVIMEGLALDTKGKPQVVLV
jgi:hypothetical protein